MKEYVDFSNLVGQKAKLYLYPNNLYQFQLGSLIFEVVEDENDGYRSYMGEVKVLRDDARTAVNSLLAEVIIQDSTDIEGFKLIDTADGHEWLSFGTDYADDYYPMFVYNWNPKLPKDLEDTVRAINL